MDDLFCSLSIFMIASVFRVQISVQPTFETASCNAPLLQHSITPLLAKTQSARSVCRIGCSANDPRPGHQYRRSRNFCSGRCGPRVASARSGGGAFRNRSQCRTARRATRPRKSQSAWECSCDLVRSSAFRRHPRAIGTIRLKAELQTRCPFVFIRFHSWLSPARYAS